MLQVTRNNNSPGTGMDATNWCRVIAFRRLPLALMDAIAAWLTGERLFRSADHEPDRTKRDLRSDTRPSYQRMVPPSRTRHFGPLQRLRRISSGLPL
jgi:hypothetical protein